MFNSSLPELDQSHYYGKAKRDFYVESLEGPIPSKARSSAYELQNACPLKSKKDDYSEHYLFPNIKHKVSSEPMTTIKSNEELLVEDGNNDSLYPDGGLRAYSVVLGSFLCCFTLFGLMNSIGAIESYVVSNQLKNVSVSTVSWIFSLYMFVSLFLGLFVGPLYDSFGSMWLLLIGSIFVFVGLITCGISTTVVQFIFSFGICTGMGTGLMMFSAVSTISSWFSKKKRSFAIGAAQSGGSVGGVVFPIMLRYLYQKYGFNWAMRIMAFFNLGVDILGAVLARDRLKEIREKTGEIDKRTVPQKLMDSVDLNAFKEKKFTALSCALFMNEFSLLIVLTYISSYAMVHGISQAESFNMLTILNAAGILGKFIPSYFADKYGTFNLMILMSSLLTFSLFVVWYPFGKYRAGIYVFICLFGFGCASVYTLTGATVSTITKKTKDFGKRYGAAYAFISFGNLISLPISGAFIKKQDATDYDKMVLFAAATCCSATVLFIIARYTVVGRCMKVFI
ncbi:hypothetical protein BRETT_001185 [Brettanomyces bruxellensis]|uniref:Major facilitator superfamily (MFS) profile domain-containing protein n=1 Tax=Dekkera bruxellensis TaxID=5007 RepID=A0A871RG61_DEKBR|nr:uncharacterized protein BRETT_001185 [Brettanomyces bruxellensis]QOU21461.1 hypothetical protein BRETT_001185 [Brettanomyces bruxellensis]